MRTDVENSRRHHDQQSFHTASGQSGHMKEGSVFHFSQFDSSTSQIFISVGEVNYFLRNQRLQLQYELVMNTAGFKHLECVEQVLRRRTPVASSTCKSPGDFFQWEFACVCGAVGISDESQCFQVKVINGDINPSWYICRRISSISRSKKVAQSAPCGLCWAGNTRCHCTRRRGPKPASKPAIRVCRASG